MQSSNIFLREISRQIDLVAVPRREGNEHLLWKTLSSETVEYKHQLEEIREILNRRHQTALKWTATEVDPELAFRIVTYCGVNPWFVDPNDLKGGLEVLIRNRQERPVKSHPSYTKLWGHPMMLQWAAHSQSCSLHLRPSLVSSPLTDIAAIDLLEYLLAKGQRVIWMFNTLSHYDADEKLDLVPKQLALQILRKNSSFRSLGQISEMVKLINSATVGDSSWLDVIYKCLEGISTIYMVIDASSPLPTPKIPRPHPFVLSDLAALIAGLRQRSSPTVLKILFYGLFPTRGVADGIPRINVERPVMTSLLSELDHPGEWYSNKKLETYTIQLPLYEKRKSTDETEATVETAPKVSPRDGYSTLSQDRPSKGYDSSRGGVKAAEFKTEDDSTLIRGRYQATNDLESSRLSQAGGVAAKSKASKNDWFHEMRSFEKCVDASRREPDELSPRIKIAIFDTGLDLTHPDIAKAYTEGRIQTYDFVEKSKSIKDIDGHGTHCTSLLINNAPNAEIYVGRFLKKSKAEANSAALLTQAIEHAISVWNVDIISLSMGFTQDDDDLRVEVLKASANKLIFAAAANNTTNEVTPIRFPARMSEVLCIFSSNNYGISSPFNPPASYDRPNFTFPGERIEGAWPKDIKAEGTFERGDSTYKYQDGTSCATAIAAAVAAGVLEYARQERERPIRRARLLNHYRGISAVFLNEMVDRHKVGDNSFHYVKPWMLMSKHQPQDEIPSWISRILEKVS